MLADPPLQVLLSELLSLSMVRVQHFLSLCVCLHRALLISVHISCTKFALRSLLISLGPTCAPMIFDRSTILVEAMAVAHVIALERPPMLLANYTMLVSQATFLGFFRIQELIDFLHFPSDPFGLFGFFGL